MKNFKMILAALLLVTSLNTMAQDAKKAVMANAPKVFAVVNKAAWCSVCKANGQRAGMVLMSYMNQGLGMTMNDFTDAKSIAASKKVLTRQGVYAAVADMKVTGVVIFVDAKTKKEIKHISLALPDDQLKSEIDGVLKSRE